MTNPRRAAKIRLEARERFQRIDGFGVNINAKYWAGGKLAPVVDLLVNDLGATLFRLDCYGRADWIDPEGVLGREAALSEANLSAVYETPAFQSALGMARHLNALGIEPYITVSGIVPRWMCGRDGVTLTDYESFAQMNAHYLRWLRAEGARFTLFGPLNETDLGPPEGPALGPEGYVLACEAMVRALDKAGLTDVKLVVPEQAQFNLRYIAPLLQSAALKGRIGAMAVHAYTDFHVRELTALLAEPGNERVCAWMSEFGDLGQSIEREQQIAWASFERLMRLLEDGMHGAMSWDAYDNYHDHDETWTCFGLLMNSWDVFTPKKRYYALKHIYRFVRPGFVRIGASCLDSAIQVMAFEGEGGKLTVVGMNHSESAVALDLDLGRNGMQDALPYLDYQVYRSCDFEDCARVTTPIIKLKNHASLGVELTALPGSLFTITNVD